VFENNIKFILVANFNLKNSELAESMDFSTFIDIHLPRKSRKDYEIAVREKYENYNSSGVNEAINNTLGNYYDKYINLNDYNYCVGNILSYNQYIYLI
jgi:hypothetical protein